MPAAYLDSCIVIYLIQGPDEFQQRVSARLSSGGAEPPDVCVSDLTRLECRVLPMRRSDTGLLAAYDRFFALARTHCLPMPREVYDLATELRATHRIETADALHLAAAIVGKCDEFWTNDRRLAKAAAGRINVVIPVE